MVFFFGDGRLGNQLFQYLFISSIGNKIHTIISYNFEDILELFDSIQNVINIRNKYIRFLIRTFFLPILDFLVKTKLISSYKVNTYDETGFIVPDVTFSKTKGLLPIIYIYPCFAQSEIFFKQDAAKNLMIKKSYLEKAEEFLAAIPEKYTKIFVHIRRTDYIDFEVLGKGGVTLPLSYYRNNIQSYEKSIENPFFVFLTDDPDFVENYFENTPNKVISKNAMFVDFAIITLCEYGIMSNSSFSWWAAYMMKVRKQVFAPEYWLGWKSKIEYHKGITPSFAEMVEVKE